VIPLLFKIIGEWFAYKYYLVPKEKRWLIYKNDRDYLIAVGNEVALAIGQASM